MPERLARNIGWTLSGNAVYALAQWIVVIAVARVADPAAVGVLAYAIALVAPPIALASLQLRVVMLTAAGRAYSLAEAYALRIVLLIASCGALALYCAVSGIRGASAWTVAGVSLWRAFDAVAEIQYAEWQRTNRVSRMSRSLLLNGVISVATVMGCVAVWPSPIAAAFGSALGSGVTVAVLLAGGRDSIERAQRRPIRAARLRELAILSGPLGVVMTLITLQGNIPRYVVEWALGPAALGVFAAASQLPLAGANVVASVATAASPLLVTHHSRGEAQAFWRLLMRLVAFGLSLGVGGAVLSWFAGGPILRVVYGSAYGQYGKLLTMLSLAAGLAFAGSFLGYGMTMAGELRPQTSLFVGVIVIAILANALLVPSHGVMGAAIAGMVTSAAQIGGSILVLRRAMCGPGCAGAQPNVDHAR